MSKIKKILIANRGEIACRIMETCRLLQIETVSIYTDSEVMLPHVCMADYSVCLGSGSLKDTYLNIDLIVEIAKKHQVDAIHPGYGFLSENALFVEAVTKSKLIFIGPHTKAIKLMGDKIASKKLIEKIKGPMIPGYHGDDQSPKHLFEQANNIGYPVLIKASAGGGGKGMRIVESADGFEEALNAAKREAKNAFDNDQVLIEKYIQNPRHIEVQVFSDSHGNHIHLYERECSIQRRYQKIIEESPSTALNAEIRSKICLSAVEISREINYLGAGTVEFIYDDQSAQFYFLEMNTRLQVEHPITEFVTGQDLVAWQIMVASGEKLPLGQADIKSTGHAIELRIYAEDPDNSFLPTLGTIEKVHDVLPSGVRLDTGFVDGNKVTMDFDPMLAKLIAWAPNRELALAKMHEALKKTLFLGCKTNLNYLHRILDNQNFIEGKTYTNFVETNADELSKQDKTDLNNAVLIAANHFKLKSQGSQAKANKVTSWDCIEGFRN